MSIWNKVLLWLIGLASIGFLILGARTLKTHQFWMSSAKKLETSLGNEVLRTGLHSEVRELNAEIGEQRLQLHKLLVDWPQVWSNCAVQVRPDRNSVVVVATIEPPADAAGKVLAPHGIPAAGTLYAFEDTPAGEPGRYLGEFNVTKVEEKQITLQPAFSPGQLDVKKINEASRAPWTFFNVLPQDNHDTFALLTEDQKKAILPADSVGDYQADGKPAGPQVPKDRIDAQGNYVRPLRDYAQLLNHARLQNTILYDEMEATTRDLALVKGAQEDAQRQVQFAQNQITEFKALLAKREKERDAVAQFNKDQKDQLEGGLLKQLKDKLAAIEAEINRLIEQNKAMAGQIAQKQLEATRLIDARTRAMAKRE
jgi:hypothetical protein